MDTDLKVNVLVVDDNEINRMLINKVLKKWGITAEFASDGSEAVDKVLNNHNYDVVLMDIHMPVMGGLEATRVIRSQQGPYFQQLPIWALTASVMHSEVTAITEAGMNDYIVKPFDPKSLFEKISQFQKQE